MNVLFPVLLITGILYLIFLQISAYNSILTDKFRFRFFALRDRLAHLVCKGELQEDSWEYQYIVDALNFHISVVETLSIENIGDVLAKFHTSPREDEAFDRIEQSEIHKDVKIILDEYMFTVLQMIERNSRWQIRFIGFVSWLSRNLHAKPRSNGHRTIFNPRRAMKAIECHRNSLNIGSRFA